MTVPVNGGRRRLTPARRRINWSAVVGVLLVLTAAYMAGSVYRGGVERDQRAECQARVNAQLVDALQQRDVANRDITVSQRALVEQRLANDEVPAGITPREADEAYLRALDALEETRDSNPIAEAPSC